MGRGNIHKLLSNHLVHGIIVILDAVVGAGSEPAPTGKRYTLSEIVRQFKTFSAKHINEKRKSTGTPVWQRNYLPCEVLIHFA